MGVYDGQKVTLYTTSDGLLSNSAGAVLDSSYNIWVSYGSFDSSFAKRFTRFNGQQWEHLTLNEVLGDDARAWYVDREGAIWFRSIDGLSVYLDTTTTRVKGQCANSILPGSLVLHQNFPNPFNSTTMIRYELFQEKNIHLSIFNLKGEEMIRLFSGKQWAGMHQVVWNGEDKLGKEVSSGIYFCVLKTDGFIEARKITLIR
ncbi:MAG: T9SS type A sorting domain-containing protein [candidate division KSB1 bacterium]|nr:T9SS type A sorting domain-containing protein [candidate division KSB1 bacterium]